MTLVEVLAHLRSSPAAPRLLASTLAALIVLALLPIYATAWQIPAVGLFHDDGVYVVTAKALAEGRGYHIISLPGAPRQTKYPPLFPAVLAAIWKVAPEFPANHVVLKAVPLAAAIGWLALTAVLLRRLGMPDIVRPVAVAAIAALPYVVYLSTALMAEMPFALLCTAALLCLEGGDETQFSRRLVLAAILGAAATMTRTSGLALLVAVPLWLIVVRRDVTGASLFSAVAILLLLPWLAWVMSSPDTGYYSASNYRDWNVLSPTAHIGLATRLKVMALNAIWAAETPAWALDAPVGPIGIALTVAALVVGSIRPAVYTRVSAWFVAAYLVMVVCWAWPPTRFVLMVLPLLVWIAVAGVPVTRASLRVVAALLFVAALVGVWHSAVIVRRGAAQGTLTTTIGDEGERWVDILAAATWIKTHTAASERLVCNLDPLYYLLTGREATRGFEANPFGLFYDVSGQLPLGTTEDALAVIRRSRAGLVVETPDLFFAEGPHLKSRYADLEARGVLREAGRTGPIRFLRVQ